jgi:hypothetical protein
MTDREKAAYIGGIMHAAAHAGCCFDHFQDHEHVGEVIDHIMAELRFTPTNQLMDQIHHEIQHASSATPQITRKEIDKLWNRMNRRTVTRTAKRAKK